TYPTRVAEMTPQVVLIDYLHRAYAASFRMMEFLARQVAATRILLLGTYRDVEARQAPPVAEALGGLARHSCHLALRGFAEDEVQQFIAAASGASAAPELARIVHRETEGNPFFVDEIVRLLAADGAIERLGDAAAA